MSRAMNWEYLRQQERQRKEREAMDAAEKRRLRNLQEQADALLRRAGIDPQQPHKGRAR